MQVPKTEEEWKRISTEFSSRWNFPHCVGAMDGKHIAIKCPANSGSNFYNYKNFFSIVLFAIVDADYKFLYVDVGRNGRISDGGILANWLLFLAGVGYFNAVIGNLFCGVWLPLCGNRIPILW